ncbi:MAG TPA: hypothetical protein DDX72_08690 [Ruminococcaceae bacterium]|nr:hypothetical protein [Oscillospiraceae bacterium]
MGLFNLSDSKGFGFAKIPNTQGFTNEVLLEKLSEITVSFGTPEMGDINGTQSVMYRKVSDMFDVFVRVDGKNIIMGKIGANGVSSVTTALSGGLDMFLGHKDEGTSNADRAVTELSEIVKKLESGESVTASNTVAAVNTASGESVEFFMKQKAISIKPKFDIFDRNEAPVYHVEGDLPRLNFSIQKNGTEVLKLKKKLIAVMPEYSLILNGSEIGKLKKKIKLTNPELAGTINGKELKIVGDLMGFDFELQVGGVTIGHIDTAQTIWQDCYRIKVLNEDYQDIMIALTIICDNVADQSGN